MKIILQLYFLLCVLALNANAQSFTERLQRKNAKGAYIVLNQSEEITRLVNGQVIATQTTPITKQSNGVQKSQTINVQSEKSQSAVKNQKSQIVSTPQKVEDDNDFDIPVIDTRKKVMARSYKVDGYRVQVFAGGNSRTDRQKAQRIGEDIKMAFPDQPVYVHFYSPRWICRMGNYRSMEEATQMLSKVKSEGFSQAVIVKGKITVQY